VRPEGMFDNDRGSAQDIFGEGIVLDDWELPSPVNCIWVRSPEIEECTPLSRKSRWLHLFFQKTSSKNPEDPVLLARRNRNNLNLTEEIEFNSKCGQVLFSREPGL